jgi:hypothetical protein
MGDAINTPFDVFVFVLIFVGIPTLIFGAPIALLGFLSARRTIQLNRKCRIETDNSLRTTEANSVGTLPVSPWLVALFLLMIVGAIVFLVFGASISQMLMLD